MRPGERFEARVVRSRRLTPTTHGIDVEKPAGFTFRPTQFIEACFRNLVSSGVTEADIRFEIFRGYAATA